MSTYLTSGTLDKILIFYVTTTPKLISLLMLWYSAILDFFNLLIQPYYDSLKYSQNANKQKQKIEIFIFHSSCL